MYREPHLQKKSDECAEIYREWEKMFLDLETRHSKETKMVRKNGANVLQNLVK